jgi:hypothetical protein
MDPTKEQHQILLKFREKCDGDRGNDWKRVRGRKHELYMESTNSPILKKSSLVKNKVKSMLIIFFDIKGIVNKNSSWKAKQSVLILLFRFKANT